MTNPIYALIIGASDYRSYDPSGAADLKGATNDAGRWASLCEGSLQLGEDQVQVLVDTDGEVRTDRASILSGMRWLGQQLGASEQRCSGLLTFSGHGLTLEAPGDTHIEQGMSLAIAPTDIEPGFAAAITFEHIERALFEGVVAGRFPGVGTLSVAQEAEVNRTLEDITVVLDACYSRPADAQGVTRSLSVGAAAGRVPHPPPRVLSRLVLACQLWETAYEIRTSKVLHGAFTYAFVTMLEQWKTGTDAGTSVHYLRAAYGDAVFRAREMVHVLGLQEQNPTLLGSQYNLALAPFLRPGAQINQAWTSARPDGLRLAEEFSSGNDDAVVLGFYGSDVADPGPGGGTLFAVLVSSMAVGSFGGRTYGFSTDTWLFAPDVDFLTGWKSVFVRACPIKKWSTLSSQASQTLNAIGADWLSNVTQNVSPINWSAVTNFPAAVPVTEDDASGTSNVWAVYVPGSNTQRFGFQFSFTGSSDISTAPYIVSIDSVTCYANPAPASKLGLNRVTIGTPGYMQMWIPTNTSSWMEPSDPT